MLRPRIIPCLLIQNGVLVKTVSFKDPAYVGDPLNAVRIYNEKEVDELIVIDIDATRSGIGPNYNLIKMIASECRMPLTYGGGVNTLEHFDKIIGLGVEKVAISKAAVDNPKIIAEASNRVGSQSVVVVIDYSRNSKASKININTLNATQSTDLDAVEFLKMVQELGAGEILLNSIDRDGKMNGYDIDTIRDLRKHINTPLTVLGGAGSDVDIQRLFSEFDLVGAAAGSLFVFKGKYKAVLINYPSRQRRKVLGI